MCNTFGNAVISAKARALVEERSLFTPSLCGILRPEISF
jgi:hypothetical protein